MDAQNIMRQISKNIVKGRFASNYQQVESGKKCQSGIPELMKLSMQKNISPALISADVLDKTMADSIKKFEEGEYNFPELAVRAKHIGDTRDILRGHMENSKSINKGKIVLATVEGENHGQGKEIVSILLKGCGFKIVDLGIDVSVDEIVRSVKYHEPVYLGISATVVSTFPKIERLIDKLSKKKSSENVSIIVGGIAARPEYAESIAADYRCSNMDQTIALLKELVNRN
jgi:5-methyltetrahydrofolate--homocysteine methyltransferase